MEQAAKGEVPQALKNMPVLDERQRYFYSVYEYVAPDRPPSMAGVAPIPNSAIRGYFDEFQIRDAEWRDTIRSRVRFLDATHREHMEEQAKSQAKK